MKTTAKFALDDVGEFLWKLREAKGISQRKLAKLAGVHEQTIAKVEAGLNQYSLPSLYKICYALGITLEQLFKAIEDKPMDHSPERAATDKVNTGLALIPWYSILELGKIFVEGLRYGRDNWKKGVHDKEYQEERLEHAMLHLVKWKEGDRSEQHLAKVAWFCVTQLELERMEREPVKQIEPPITRPAQAEDF